MKRNAFVLTAFSAVVALGITGSGCSSSSSTGTGGATGTGSGGVTGAGGHLNGAGGTGPVDAHADVVADSGSDASTSLPVCNPAPDDGTTCNNNPTCTKNCGVNIAALGGRAMKTCTCSGTWSCPSTASACVYPPDVNLDCLRLPTPLPACPTFTADGGAADAGATLIRSGTTTCTPPSSEVCGNVCGSATAGTFSYQDSSGAGKVGYCVCVNGTFQCASVSEWPTF